MLTYWHGLLHIETMTCRQHGACFSCAAATSSGWQRREHGACPIDLQHNTLVPAVADDSIEKTALDLCTCGSRSYVASWQEYFPPAGFLVVNRRRKKLNWWEIPDREVSASSEKTHTPST